MHGKTIGVLGGMGPESTAELLVRITRATPVEVEQDHHRVVIDSNPRIPNRTEALLTGNHAPVVDALTATARYLEQAGAQVLGIPCNTAHAFVDAVRQAVSIPVIDMVAQTSRRASELFDAGAAVGILATDGTLHVRLYHDALARVGLAATTPSSPELQRTVMATLDGVKLSGVTSAGARNLTAAIQDMRESSQIKGLIAGCTEASLVLEQHTPPLPWLDPLQELAEALVREATIDEEND